MSVQNIQSAALSADLAGEDGDDGFNAGDLADDQKLASAIVRLLVADGWLETAEDRVRLAALSATFKQKKHGSI